jgi:hypothetical protein
MYCAGGCFSEKLGSCSLPEESSWATEEAGKMLRRYWTIACSEGDIAEIGKANISAGTCTDAGSLHSANSLPIFSS